MRRIWRIAGGALLVFTVLCTVGMGTAAATSDVSVQNPADGETTNHEWNVTLASDATGTLDNVTLDYTGTGADLSGAAWQSEVLIDGTPYSVDGTQSATEIDHVDLSLASDVRIDGSETVEVTLFGVTNPDTVGTHPASMELRNSETTFQTESMSFTVEDGGYVNGTVAKTDGTALDGASVSVLNGSTYQSINWTWADVSGQYSHYVPAGTYLVSASADGHEYSTKTVTVQVDVETTADFALREKGYLNGSVTNATGADVADASLTLRNNTVGDYFTTTANATGNYSFFAPNGTYSLIADAPGYTAKTVTVHVSGTAVRYRDVTLEEAAYINGSVKDGEGKSVGAGVIIGAESESDGSFTTAVTDANGDYSLAVDGGAHEVVVVDPDYEYQVVGEVTVARGEVATLDVQATELPEKGTVTGTVVGPDGTPVGSGVQVSAGDSSYTFFNRTFTDGNGEFTMQVPEATYRIRAETPDRPTVRVSGVDVTANQETDVTIELSAVSYIDGTVTNASGGVENAFVVADGAEGVYFNQTDANGDYNVTAPPGNYSVSVFTSGQDAAPETVATTSGRSSVADFELVTTEILASSVSITDGTGDENEDDIEVRAAVQNGLLQVQLVDGSSYGSAPGEPAEGVGKPDDLEAAGVTDATRFEMTVTVTNFTASSLLWGLDDAEWTATDNDTRDDATDVTIRGSPVTLQANVTANPVGPLLFQDPADVHWTTGSSDRATDGFNQTVYVGVFDLSSVPDEVRDNLDGISVTTNAQRFSTPRIVDDSLRVWVGAPGTTVDGETHSGFYQATIPEAQLDEWGVDDPETELKTLYKGSETSFTVTETRDGARIRLEGIGYSAGFVEVQADPNSAGSSGESTYYGGSEGGSTSTPSPTPTPTETTPSPTESVTEPPVTTGTDTETRTSTPVETELSTETTTDDQPGFGAAAALLAVLGFSLLARRRGSS